MTESVEGFQSENAEFRDYMLDFEKMLQRFDVVISDKCSRHYVKEQLLEFESNISRAAKVSQQKFTDDF